MRKSFGFTLLALLVGACAIPDVTIVESLDGEAGNSGSDEGGAPSEGGTRSGDAGMSGKANSGAGEAGDDGGGTAGNSPSTGGTSATGGKGSGGSGANPNAGSTSTGGSGGDPSGAVAKFCNNVTVGGEFTDFVLRIGTGQNRVSIVATSGSCQPIVNEDCASVPTGSAVPFTVVDANDEEWWGGDLTIAAGEAWIYAFDYDADAQAVTFVGLSEGITAEQCAGADFEDVFASSAEP
jgi:hypothetical protein